ncbi:MAG: MBL fold metallo-hydrolase, partial [Actinomycetia bacterium]|nr:MBL fold metallo-hydrolase [Actinomycetes bacterium]
QALTVRREFGARVGLGRGERESVDLLMSGAESAARANVEQLRESGAQHLAYAWAHVLHEQQDGTVWEQPDDWIDDGQTLTLGGREIVAVATPGHTQGHVIFVDHDAGVLYSGDHILSATTPVIGIEPATSTRPLANTLDSLRKVLALPDLRLLSAHGPVLPSSHARARELLAHHERRLELCRAAVHTGKASAYEVALALAWTKNEQRLTDLDEIGAVMATLQTRAYLELLSTTGALERHVDTEVVLYVAASTNPSIPRADQGA